MSALISHIAERITNSGAQYVHDLESMPDHMLEESPGGCARSPYDFTYEVVHVNRRVAATLRKEDPGAWPFEGWAEAPPAFRSKDKAIGELQESIELVLAAWRSLSEAEALEPVEPDKPKSTYLGLGSLVATHMAYHDGQLNFIQAIHGDSEVHWK